jgi:superfamily II DNA or RNA helicase
MDEAGAVGGAGDAPQGVVLRPYQVAAVEAIGQQFAAGHQRTLLVLPTGTGKTQVFAQVIAQAVARGARALVLAHRTELLAQAQARLEAVGLWAQREQADQRAGLARVVVASVQTLRGARLQAWAPTAFGLIVIDECHRATAAGYEAIVRHFADADVLGVTATADRADGQRLGRLFPTVAYELTLRDALRGGWLAPICARRVELAVDLDTVRTVAGELDAEELGSALTAPAALAGVVAPLLALAGARPTLVFAVTVAHAHALVAALNARRPGCARAVSGASSPFERQRAAVDLAAGRVQFVANAQLWTEGFDLPAISCVALVRPTKSRALYTQMVGRGTRLAPGKTDCLVLDFTGNTRRHRLMSPVDLFGPAPPEAARRRAEQHLTTSGGDVQAVVDAAVEAEARAAIDAAAAAAAARQVRWISQDVLELLGDEVPEDPATVAAPPTLATHEQRAVLAAAGIAVAPALTAAEAQRVLEALGRRHRAGLATYKQVRLLRTFGVDATHLSKLAAMRQISERLAARGAGRRWP